MDPGAVAQVSKPAVSPISKSADRKMSYDVLRLAGLETCDTADLEVCATVHCLNDLHLGCQEPVPSGTIGNSLAFQRRISDRMSPKSRRDGWHRLFTRAALFLAIIALAIPASAAGPQKLNDGVIIPVGDKFLKLEVCADNVIRVAVSPDATFFSRKSLSAGERHDTRTHWSLSSTGDDADLTTDALHVHVDLHSGAVSFFDSSGKLILAEKADGRTLTPAIVQGDSTYHVRQEWMPNDGEAFFGLGQQQLGLMNLKGYDLDLWQHNGTVAIPMLLSSRGYGIFWDNTSYTRFGDLREAEPIPPSQLLDQNSRPGGLIGSYFTGENFGRLVGKRLDPQIDIAIPSGATNPNQLIYSGLPDGDISVRWEGYVLPDETGDYLLETFSNNGIKLWVDDKLVISHWRQGWLPWWNVARVHFEAGQKYRLKLEWTKEQGMETVKLLWKTPSHDPNTSLWSEVGQGIDYYFMYGPSLDKVIAGYRQITGQAPMMPEWVFGFFQSRQRYKTQQESLDVLDGYRSRKIPIDNIVQDWFYWKENQWGSHEFDPSRFPDPDGWIRDIHQKYHARLTISVWPKFYAGTTNFEIMRAHHFLLEENLAHEIQDWIGYPDTFYDAFNADARKMFWSQINAKLFSRGVDGWWMDASEPDMLPTPTLEGQRAYLHPTALGTGAAMLNGYPLENSKAVYEGQRKAKPDQRVFILTRSAFAGMQRYSAAVWSGDTSSTWTAMRAQITAGLGFCLSGLPYWSMDSGGFSVPSRFSSGKDFDEWCELNARWFEFATFVPLLRVHGEYPNREMWEFGGDSSPTYAAQVRFDRLRYRLMPYIYSLAGNVTHQGGTIMRALVMDFPADTNVFNIGDEYMFGPALLINPVTTYRARSRPVYLPQDPGGWYDFWTGQHFVSGRTVQAAAPFNAIPVFARAGSIVPFGPEIQYTGEKPADPLTIYIYTGADGDFTLYEDDGLTYDYERGAFATIPLHWDDSAETLTIGKRNGSFDGMLKQRTIQIVLVSPPRHVGFSFTPNSSQTVKYQGKELSIKFE
ncbi:MAG TPA: TIM-barrel domain-containing protein [Candidatus Sulfotelmatobacter sp.]|nr:TIM-barrel domain-containing protein [Candidatus Sulfotelmatobacter sp.]